MSEPLEHCDEARERDSVFACTLCEGPRKPIIRLGGNASNDGGEGDGLEMGAGRVCTICADPMEASGASGRTRRSSGR